MYWSAFLFGFLGSFHCVGMCGPIVLSVPGRAWWQRLLYNLGRTVTYAALGAAVGVVGQGFSLAGWQQALSILVGSAMLIIILFTRYRSFDLPLSGPLQRLWLFAKNKLAAILQSKHGGAPLVIGLVNGLLPCGLVYAALFAALATGGVLSAMGYMAIFGLGTTPMLLIVAAFGQRLSPAVRHRFNKLVPWLLAVVAVLLILRGLNLGIPYISPNLDQPGHMHHAH
ncbi:MAG TPA: sulfite exporter TauE/SafE family protein [Flammeovirgaceae bacterium]|nr:sulfite exporter TauE/SafE family protein [Flammeovirgaceae bacterium]